MRSTISGEIAWGVIFSLVVAHELTADEGQLLSEAVDRALLKHPMIVYVFTGITVAHLLNRLPTKLDPYARAALFMSAKRKALT